MEKKNQGSKYRYVLPNSDGYNLLYTYGGKCKIQRPDGTMVSDIEWDAVAEFREGVCRVTKDNKDFYIHPDGTLLTKEKYDWASYYFKNGYAKVFRIGSGHNVIRKDGTEVFDSWYPEIDLDNVELPAGIAVVKDDDKNTVFVFDMENMLKLETIDDIVKYANTSYRVNRMNNSFVAEALPADEVRKRRQLALETLMQMDSYKLALHILDNCRQTVVHDDHQCCPHYSSNV